ncbi:Phosphoribosylglycinamide formyltransferase [Planctomycetes bacterium LzC2]|uniref:phosphoribosylglycinamide formyltransferase 1 n=1 Tax=Alienimonas chondri TaxID=2681879 RepID=A0ABX1VI90_9PLAN|nr:Phosphoribosylglycinamide formyltransferase [Alienimonas chondri]
MRLACLISGGGRTVLNLQEKIAAGALNAEIVSVLASRDCAGVGRCEAAGLSVEVVSPRRFPSEIAFGEAIWGRIEQRGADLTVLAGFLSRLPIPERWELRVMNIHPSLLPAFGGAGMYGDRVHRAALARGVTVSGCTVHFVTEEYDAGPIVSQSIVPVEPDDDADALAARVFAAECDALPAAVREWAGGRLEVTGNRVRIVRRPLEEDG